MNFDDTIMKDYQVQLVMLDRTTVSDGYGGFNVVWQEGAEFTAVMTQTKQYKIVTGTNILLNKDDYFRRKSDGKNFKILNSNYDRLAPDDSTLQMRATTAEEVELPNE